MTESSSSSLSSAVADGQLEALEAIRDRIAADLDACESMRDKAALYARLMQALDAIAELKPAEQKGDAVDEIAARRSARGAGPASRSARA